MNLLEEKLKSDVQNHSVLTNPWLLSRNKELNFEDLVLWLSQEYFVSIGFVDWFLLVAAKTKNQKAKIILVENIWEELGEGKIEDTHVSILETFLNKLGFDLETNKIFPETKEYLSDMSSIIEKGFYFGLGALGPANEYLLKLEYSLVSDAYQILKEKQNLPEGKFFSVNLEADEGHSKRMFDLITEVALTEKEKEEVISGNLLALDAREKFYIGLERISPSKKLISST
ncbi:iron-containing redox enzyme family protein [Leptospira sp. 'Mane']|uniref:iron-containing redox enzyme family protein n=1 Tax=Leptospira sp. 'Mane' TaxID=3387407 RepID=UPI00398ADA1F